MQIGTLKLSNSTRTLVDHLKFDDIKWRLNLENNLAKGKFERKDIISRR